MSPPQLHQLRAWLLGIRSEDPLVQQRGTIMVWLLFPLLLSTPILATQVLPAAAHPVRGALMFTSAEALYLTGLWLARRGSVNASGLLVTLFMSLLLLLQPVLVEGFSLYLFVLIIPLTLAGLVLSPRYVLGLFTIHGGVLLMYKALGMENLSTLNLPDHFVYDVVLLLGLVSVAAWINATVSERTFAQLEQMAELERTQLEAQAKRARAEEASAAKNRFLANMSHELRTPLNTIIGYSEILLEDQEHQETPNPQTQHDVSQIHVAGTNLLRLVDDVLALSNIESGLLPAQNDTFDITTLVREVSEHHAANLDVGKNKLHLEGFDAPTPITTDRARVRQILSNLLDNAAKFTSDGDVFIRIHQLDPAHISLEVQDTGIGIPPERHEHLFEAFVQVDDSTTRRHGGTGLGLTLCKRLCELLGGHIEFESEPGSGTTFRVVLPA